MYGAIRCRTARLTGGFAAPIFAGGVAMLAGSTAAAGIATTAGAAILGSVFGVAGAGLAGYKMNRRVGAIEEFSIETLSRGKSLHISLVVSGWITEENEDSFRSAWRNLNDSAEQYCLRYESKYLLQLGQAFDYIMTFAVSYAIQQTLMETALAGIVSALAWPLSILTVGNVVDNPWNVGVRRSTEVGEHLAHLLLSRQHGNRPITLMGFSLGARVVYHCLLEMTKHDQRAVGLVEDVVLLGAPVTGSPGDWKKISSVVAGRVINGYCRIE
uniref:Transmembrane and coiled-coil domain-containing protein 4 n=1 Tax=Romanomermis culicivorax TaxID=13658 RepID=A0A915KAV5_ROMCU